MNYKCPSKCAFCFFVALFVVFWIFVFYLEMFQTFHRLQRDTNFEHEKSRVCKGNISFFVNWYISRLQKNWSSWFPWKTGSDLSKIFTTSLPNLTKSHRRKREKIHSQFCSLWSCWCNKISKTLTYSFERAHITMQCSTNWAIKPSGSWSLLSSYLFVQFKYTIFHILTCIVYIVAPWKTEKRSCKTQTADRG